MRFDFSTENTYFIIAPDRGIKPFLKGVDAC